MTEPVRALVPAPKAPAIGGTGKALPPHRHDQTELAQLSLELFPALAGKEEALARFFRRVGVEGRNLALPAAEYRELDGLGARNDAWLRVAMDLATEATTRALADAGLQASDIDQIITTTVTGIAVPSIDARLVNRLDFRTDVKRVPLFGLGCLGGAAGIARAADYLAGHPDQAVLLVSVLAGATRQLVTAVLGHRRYMRPPLPHRAVPAVVTVLRAVPVRARALMACVAQPLPPVDWLACGTSATRAF